MAEKKESKMLRRTFFMTGLVLCIVFGAVLICNLIIIVKGTINPDRPPSVAGITPMVVMSGSMSGTAEDHIEVGDLIFVGKADIGALKVGDVITFSEANAATVVTHRIKAIQTAADGSREFITKGDANNIEDDQPVSADRVIGIYRFRIAGVGNFAMFLQKPLGMILFIGVPVLAFIIYDIIRRQRYASKDRKKSEEMETELARLRALTNQTDESREIPSSVDENSETARK